MRASVKDKNQLSQLPGAAKATNQQKAVTKNGQKAAKGPNKRAVNDENEEEVNSAAEDDAPAKKQKKVSNKTKAVTEKEKTAKKGGKNAKGKNAAPLQAIPPAQVPQATQATRAPVAAPATPAPVAATPAPVRAASSATTQRSASPTPDKSSADEAILAKVLAKINSLEAQIANYENQNNGPEGQGARPIPKLKDYNKQELLGYEDKKYDAMRARIRVLCEKCNLNTEKTIRHQDTLALGKLYTIARKEYPELARFENDWLTVAMVQQYLSAHVKHIRNPRTKKATKPGSTSRAAILIDEDAEMGSGTEESPALSDNENGEENEEEDSSETED